MKIAIAGTGISGLVAAHLLHREHDVTVFEADSRIGGHTHTFDVEVDGEQHAVDTGFIVFNTKTYPNFVKLLDRIGVESDPTDMSFGLACERSGLEWGSRGLGSLFAQRRNALKPAFWRMLRDVVRFNRESRALLAAPAEKVTLGDYLCGAGYSEEFVHQYLLPMGAAIWSANPSTFLDFPATSFVRFFENHGLLETPPRLPWRVIRGGSSRYLAPLTAAFRDRIHTSEPLRGVRRRGHFVEVVTSSGIERFDHVILAMHSDQALRVLLDASGLERAILGAIRYQPNEVVLHRDTSLMPGTSRAWASWNYRIPAEDGSAAIVTYDMNRLQNIQSRHRFLVTLNGSNQIDPSLIHDEFRYDHPVFDEAAIQAQRRHADISGRNRVHFCGAYWGYGFHEDGVASALKVCRNFGVEL
jgi:predicted NAD/FAD-binding protein